MPRRRPARKQTPLATLPFGAALLLALAVLAFWLYQHRDQLPGGRQAQTPPVSTSPDLIEADRLIYGGIPRPRADAPASQTQFTLLKNRGYVTGYSESRKNPLWVAYRVFHTPNPHNLPRPTGGFITDTRIGVLVKDGDYLRSGYDRGHMAPNSAIARCYGREAQLETFLMTNISPQTPALNAKVWERLEAAERAYADELEEVWVFAGPIFADTNGGATQRLASGIAVPRAFYRILIDEEGRPGGKPRIFAVIMPQDVKGTELPQQFLSTVRAIEEETGLDFLWKLDDDFETPLESDRHAMWPRSRQ